jgi:hypothetical protein
MEPQLGEIERPLRSCVHFRAAWIGQHFLKLRLGLRQGSEIGGHGERRLAEQRPARHVLCGMIPRRI